VNRRALGAMILTSLVMPRRVLAQTPKLWRIAYLSGASAENDKTRMAAFREGLQALGYIEGKNLAIHERYADARLEKLPALAQDLVHLKADVFVVYGAASAIPAVQSVSRTVPIIFTVSADPIGDGIVTNLARPGGQVTGFSDLHSALVSKRLELLKELLPSASRVAVLARAASRVNRLQLKDIQETARAFGVVVLPLPVSGAAEVDAAFKTMAADRPAGLIVLGDFLLATHRRQILRLAMSNRIPTIFTTREAAQDGALMSYGTYLPDLWRRSATYVDKILKGAKPGDLPVEQAARFELVINLKTAKAIGVAVPRPLLLRADQIIE
jgi:putative tryptophan/tyrosine transport system substrate-binding protein